MRTWKEIATQIYIANLKAWFNVDKKDLMDGFIDAGYSEKCIRTIQEALHLMTDGFSAKKVVAEMGLDTAKTLKRHFQSSASFFNNSNNPEEVQKQVENHLTFAKPNVTREEFYFFLGITSLMVLAKKKKK